MFMGVGVNEQESGWTEVVSYWNKIQILLKKMYPVSGDFFFIILLGLDMILYQILWIQSNRFC